MPPQATKDWLSLLETKARDRGIAINTDLESRIFHFELGRNPGVLGKVRYSAAENRDYESEQGQKHIWIRYDREKNRIKQGSKRKVVNITLDVRDKDRFDPTEHHFLFLTEQLLRDETYSEGDQKIWIEGDGQYSGPLAKYIDDWDGLFAYATGTSEPSSSLAAHTGSEATPAKGESLDVEDTAGHVTESQRIAVQVSDRFKQRVYDRFDHRCPLTGIEMPALLTVSHVLGRADNQEVAEDIENVVLLDWTHHMAFDAGLWTFDESGRLWIRPGFETASESLNDSLLDRHGEKIESFAQVADDYIEQHNTALEWWPPR